MKSRRLWRFKLSGLQLPYKYEWPWESSQINNIKKKKFKTASSFFQYFILISTYTFINSYSYKYIISFYGNSLYEDLKNCLHRIRVKWKPDCLLLSVITRASIISKSTARNCDIIIYSHKVCTFKISSQSTMQVVCINQQTGLLSEYEVRGSLPAARFHLQVSTTSRIGTLLC